MKKIMSLFICISVLLTFCAGCGNDQLNVSSDEKEAINNTQNVNVDEVSNDNIQKDFIQQHIDYINNGSYKEDIVSGYSENMSGILEDASKDDSLDDYIVWRAVNDVLQADYEDFAEHISLNADDKYNLLLSELLFRNEGADLQNLLVENIAETTIDSVDIISSVLLELVKAEKNLYGDVDVDSILSLNNQLAELNPWSSRYNEVFDEMCRQIDGACSHFSIDEIVKKSNNKISEELGDTSFIMKLGLDMASTISEDIISYINYVRYGKAYLNTNEYIKQVFQQMLVFSAFYSSNEFSDFTIFNKALESYISLMEEYKYDQAKSFASKASKLYGDITSDTAETVTKDICLQGVDCLLSIIPVIGPALIAARDGSAILQTIWDVCADTDDRAYARDMVYHCNIMAEVLFDVSEYYAQLLIDSDQKELGERFKEAACFDATINMYKYSCIIGAEYAEKYETYLYNKSFSTKKKSWYSTAINIASTQILLSSEIQCHDSYFPSEPISVEKTISYDDIINAMNDAAIFAWDWFWDNNHYDSNNSLSENGIAFYKINESDIGSKADLEKLSEKYFTSDVTKHLMSYKEWIEQNNSLYVSENEGLGGLFLDQISVQIEKKSDTEYAVDITEYGLFADGSSEIIDTYTVSYELVNGNWVFDKELAWPEKIPISILDENSKNDLKKMLTSGYWWNNIQDINAYQFNIDGTWNTVNIRQATYIGNPPLIIDGGKAAIGDSGTYSIENNKVILKNENGYQSILCYLDINEVKEKVLDDLEWKMVKSLLDEYSYSGKILYELDYERKDFDNAMWIVPYDENKAIVQSNLTIYDYLGTYININYIENHDESEYANSYYTLLNLVPNGNEIKMICSRIGWDLNWIKKNYCVDTGVLYIGKSQEDPDYLASYDTETGVLTLIVDGKTSRYKRGCWIHHDVGTSIDKDIIKSIRNIYNDTQDNLDSFTKQDGKSGTTRYFSGQNIRKIVAPSGTYTDGMANNLSDFSVEYYFDENEELIFVFAYKGTEEYRFYMSGSYCIRFIDKKGVTYDLPNADDSDFLTASVFCSLGEMELYKAKNE